MDIPSPPLDTGSENHLPGSSAKDEEAASGRNPRPTAAGAQRVLLVGLHCAERSRDFTADESLEELELLVDTWGGVVVGRIIQSRLKPDPSWYVGKGKLDEVTELARMSAATTIVADGELSPVQLRNIERRLGESDLDLRVVDRTQIILEIFARRASSREGKLEVALAQAVYALPRLAGKGLILSRLGGGIGTRGPGETKLEVDRRRLRQRITDLKREIAEVGRQREVQARARREAKMPLAALVGYTNAGKSSVFNRLTGAGVLVEDKLFATLDPVVRRLDMPGNQGVLLSDTVGFIRKLPHHLVAAFRATLEEVRGATALIHVIDASDPSWPNLESAAGVVLAEVKAEQREAGADSVPIIFALNKCDRLPGGREEALRCAAARELSRTARVIALSAVTGEGVDDLLAALAEVLMAGRRVFTLRIPYDQTSLLSTLHEQGRIVRKTYLADGIQVEVELETATGQRLEATLREDRRE
jgi:GTP-binding protein HflX